MDSFDVMISPKALEQLSRYVEYIHDTLLNPIAAERVWKDAMDRSLLLKPPVAHTLKAWLIASNGVIPAIQ